MIHRFIILISIGIFLAPLFANSEKKLCKDIESTYRAWEKKQNLSYRKKKFIRLMCLRVWKENYRILHTRMALLNVMKKKHQKKFLTPQEKKFLRKACEYYKVSDWRYLVDRIDVIPISMAVAQSIQECGWGKSLGCLKKNAYFGMTKGKECYQYSTPERSVQAYVRTLNTHKGYKNFRAIRRMMRERNQELLGCILVKELYSYCQDPGYPKIIQYIVKKYRLSVFDLMMENMHRCMVKNNRFRQEDLDFKQYCFHLAKHSEGVKVLAKVLWKKIYKNFSELFSSAA